MKTLAYKLVNMAELLISSDGDIFAIHGLGSCLGVVIHDPMKGIGAMAHIMLPCNLTDKSTNKPGKYVDTAIDEMLAGLKKLGCTQENLVAKLCGGARMFASNKKMGESIGDKNIKAVKMMLKEKGIPIIAEDLGSTYGRIVEFDVKSGKMLIKTAMAGTKII